MEMDEAVIREGLVRVQDGPPRLMRWRGSGRTLGSSRLTSSASEEEPPRVILG